MARYVVFLRAVNVGGRKLKMDEARKVLQDGGFGDVESYIQTGNVHVSTPLRSVTKVEQTVGRLLGEHAGFDIVAVVRTPVELRALVKSVDGTRPALAGEPTRYVSFCVSAPSADAVSALERWEGAGEHASVIGKDVLMEYTVPFNEAKLTGARLEKILGVPGTARNLTVVRALAQKWGA